MKNEHGLDVPYVKKKLQSVLNEIDCFTPDELDRALNRIALSQTKKKPLAVAIYDVYNPVPALILEYEDEDTLLSDGGLGGHWGGTKPLYQYDA